MAEVSEYQMNYFPDSTYDYGNNGRMGVATPQANPTVEAEFSILFPRTVSLQASRLICDTADPKQRLMSYIQNLDKTLLGYGGMKLTSFGFACTGSSYLVGADAEQVIEEELSDQFGYPVVLAASAIRSALQAVGAERIVLVSPYPDWLSDAAHAYWTASGFQVTNVRRVATRTTNTETIYELSSADALPLLRDSMMTGVDAVLISGTGMPTLSAIHDVKLNVPIISSNLCLAWRLLQVAGKAELLETDHPPFIRGWGMRLSEARSSSPAG